MAIAGAVIIPVDRKEEQDLLGKLKILKEITVEGVGEKGIALVLETETLKILKTLSKEISEWKEVLEFQVVYFNVEDEVIENSPTSA